MVRCSLPRCALTVVTGNELLAAQYLLGDTDSDLEGELEEGAPDEPLHALHLDAQQVITTLFSNPNFLQVSARAMTPPLTADPLGRERSLRAGGAATHPGRAECARRVLE